MDNNSLIQQEFEKLPSDIKEAIGRVDWRGKVRDVAIQEKLDEEKTSALETETMFILFGIIFPEHYRENLVNEVGLDEETATRIEKAVTEEIFNEVEKQYEMIEAALPKAEEVVPTVSQPPVEESIAPTQPSEVIEPASEPIPTPAEPVPEIPIPAQTHTIAEAPVDLPLPVGEVRELPYLDLAPHTEPTASAPTETLAPTKELSPILVPEELPPATPEPEIASVAEITIPVTIPEPPAVVEPVPETPAPIEVAPSAEIVVPTPEPADVPTLAPTESEPIVAPSVPEEPESAPTQVETTPEPQPETPVNRIKITNMVEPPKPKSLEVGKPSDYPSGKDPYREPIE